MRGIRNSKMYRKLFLFFTLILFLIGFLLWNNIIPLRISYFQIRNNDDQITINLNKINHYGAIIDAGSSGSRLFLYTWPTHSGNVEELLDIQPLLDSRGHPISKKITPGLSSFADKPDDVMVYIKQLLDVAASSIPQQQHRETPLYVMATAGMRMISKEAQQKILHNIRVLVKNQYRFLFSDSHAKVISGREEGIYGWITTNYLLGRFDRNHSDGTPLVSVPLNDSPLRSQTIRTRKRTVGIIDMGGGSMQIAYELGPGASRDTTSTNILNLGCKDSDVDHTYKLFVTTFLGFGANIARTRYERMLLKDFLTVRSSNASLGPSNNMSSVSDRIVLEDPCLHPGLELVSSVRLVNDSQGGLNLSPKQLTLLPQLNATYKGTGKYSSCKDRLAVLMDNKPCVRTDDKYLRCTISGRLHPQIDLKNMHFYGFSEFWYSTNDVFELGGRYNFFKLHSEAIEHCRQNWFSIILKQKKGVYRRADWPRLSYSHLMTLKRYQCFKTAWITTVLHEGLGFPATYNKFTSVSEINKAEVQWSLGALLYQTRFFPLRVIEEKERRRRREILLRRGDHPGSHTYMLLLASILVAVLLMWMHTRQHWSRSRGQRTPPRDRDGATIISLESSSRDFHNWM